MCDTFFAEVRHRIMVFLAALILGQIPQPPSDGQKELAALFAQAHLKTEPLDHGTLDFKDGSDDLHICAELTDGKLSAVRMSSRWLTKTAIPQTRVDDWATKQQSRAELLSNLDGVLFATQVVRFEQVSMNTANLQKGIAAAKEERKKFVTAFPDLKPSWQELPPASTPIDQEKLIDGLTGSDMRMLVHDWQIEDTSTRWGAASLSSWICLVRVGEEPFTLRGLVTQTVFSPGFLMVYQLPVPATRDKDALIKRINDRKWDLLASKGSHDGVISIQRKFEIKKPIPIREIKVQMDAFSNAIQQVKQL